MTQRTNTARHRSTDPTLTPFSGISLGSVPVPAVAGRSGLVLALSSGLVASMGLPATAAGDEPAAVTASIPLVSPQAADAALASTPVDAPANAKVEFEHKAFGAVAAGAAATRTPSDASRDITSISRSLASSAYRAEVAAKAAKAAAAARAAEATRAARSTTVSRSASRSTSTSSRSTTSVKASSSITARGSQVISIASRYLGVPYVYGGASPRGFDCSGLTMYVYGLLGVSLPRSAAAQYGATTRIARSQAVPGDLVFFFTGGSVTHVGIYLGGNMMLAAPHTGDVVKRETIYTANVAFGRV